MTDLAITMVAQSLDSFVNLDAALARRVCRLDDEVDHLNNEIIKGWIQLMQKSPEMVEAGPVAVLRRRATSNASPTTPPTSPRTWSTSFRARSSGINPKRWKTNSLTRIFHFSRLLFPNRHFLTYSCLTHGHPHYPGKNKAMLAEKSPPLSWTERARRQLSALVDRPVLLLLVLLAVNAVTRPYANIAHDTRLYSIQVVNQCENGAFNDDLFFRYGSQDSFSVFSRIMAPLVKVLGLEIAFFIVYLVGTTILIAAMIRIVRRLIADRLLALLALLFMVIAPLEFGGQGTLRVHETFLTPRLLSMGLALLGLDYC